MPIWKILAVTATVAGVIAAKVIELRELQQAKDSDYECF